MLNFYPLRNIAILFAASCILFSVHIKAQAPSWEWAKTSINSNFDTNYALATDENGNIYVGGAQKSPTATFGTHTITNTNPNYDDGYIVKYNPFGEVVWVKNIGGILDERVLNIAVKNNNVYITGNFNSPTLIIDNVVLNNPNESQSMFVVKLNNDGVAIWGRNPTGSSANVGSSIGVDDSENVFVSGTFGASEMTIDDITIYNNDLLDGEIYLLKFDASGTALWARTGRGSSNEYTDAIAIDGEGNVYIAGTFFSPTVTFDNTVLTNTSSDYDIFIVKYNSNGVVQWAKKCGGNKYDIVRDIKTDHQGNIIICGHFESAVMYFGNLSVANPNTETSDIFIAKFNSDGTPLWAKRAGNSSADIGTGVAVDSSDNIYLSGSIGSTGIVFGNLPAISTNGNYDIFVAKYNALGTALWSKNTGSVNYELGANAVIDLNDNLYISGIISSDPVFFDNQSIGTTAYGIFTAQMRVGVLATDDFDVKKYSIFPNPVKSNLSIQSATTNISYRITDLNGRGILKGQLQSSNTIDVSLLQNGIYLIQLDNHSYKFIKE